MLLLPIGLFAPVAAATALLLDGMSATVAGAYSLRKLRSAYTGPAVRVRRSSDNAEQDIGFASGALNTVALLTFCGAGNGFVSRWYDQGGAGQDVAQVSAGEQPQVVSAGSVIALNNATARPALRWSNGAGTDLYNNAFALPGTTYAAASVASRTNSQGSYPRLIGFNTPGAGDYAAGGAIFGYLSDATTLSGYQVNNLASGTTGTAPFQAASVFSGTGHTMTLDGSASGPVAASGSLPATGVLSIGQGSGAAWDGLHAEHIVVQGALSGADQAAIRASQRAYYGTP